MTQTTKKILVPAEFKYRAKHGDGLCTLCGEWTLGKAVADSENIYCKECDNRTVCGVNVAKSLGLIEVKE